MTAVTASARTWSVGDTITLSPGAVTRTTLALFAGGSGDHNPIHLDLPFEDLAGLHDHPGVAGRLLPPGAGPVQVPGARHPHVGAERRDGAALNLTIAVVGSPVSYLKMQQQVLPARLNGLDRAAHHPQRPRPILHASHRRAEPRHPPPHQHAGQRQRALRDSIALRHGGLLPKT